MQGPAPHLGILANVLTANETVDMHEQPACIYLLEGFACVPVGQPACLCPNNCKQSKSNHGDGRLRVAEYILWTHTHKSQCHLSLIVYNKSY